jgi:5-methylthioadenosine/S-adenosylhomocysteine deaminase
VAQADPSSIELVIIDGDLAYGRFERVKELSAPDEQERLEEVFAWGKRMLLDTSTTARPATTPRTVAQLREDLIAEYPQVGPIFA